MFVLVSLGPFELKRKASSNENHEISGPAVTQLVATGRQKDCNKNTSNIEFIRCTCNDISFIFTALVYTVFCDTETQSDSCVFSRRGGT